MLRDSGYFTLELFIPVVFYLVLSLVSGSIALDHFQLDLFLLVGKAGSDDG